MTVKTRFKFFFTLSTYIDTYLATSYRFVFFFFTLLRLCIHATNGRRTVRYTPLVYCSRRRAMQYLYMYIDALLLHLGRRINCSEGKWKKNNTLSIRSRIIKAKKKSLSHENCIYFFGPPSLIAYYIGTTLYNNFIYFDEYRRNAHVIRLCNIA